MFFKQVFDPRLAQNTYIVGCQRTGEALVVDPERDVGRYEAIAAAEGLRITAVTETHIHADFLSGCREFHASRGVTVYLSGEGGEGWDYGWTSDPGAPIHLVKDGDVFNIGLIEVRVVHTPGHTPEHLSFMVTDRGGGADEPMGLVSGDFVFVGDLGRPDLLETAAGQQGAQDPAARQLYASAIRFLELPDYLQVWPGHGAGSACGKALGAVPNSTVGYERRFSPALHHVQAGEQSFIDFILDGQPEPPTYFARMKRWNRDGPPVRGHRAPPDRLDLAGFERAVAGGAIPVDTRPDRTAFMAGHVQGSLYAPLDKTFPTTMGSYVEPDQAIVLLAEPHQIPEAVTGLTHIGLDRVKGWLPPSEALTQDGLVQITVEDMDGVEHLRQEASAVVLDVRGAVEFEAGHVPGAFNVAHTRLSDRLGDLPDGRLLVHCRSGARAAAAAAYLERAGREVVYVDDLYTNWSGAQSASTEGQA